jgi:hypothetical protein
LVSRITYRKEKIYKLSYLFNILIGQKLVPSPLVPHIEVFSLDKLKSNTIQNGVWPHLDFETQLKTFRYTFAADSVNGFEKYGRYVKTE